ncbi:MAG: ABC transporter substrate-binding protein [Deltaproteobacteria bacterium]|jgi:branched-chain amino acid transport system substrate-binding protein|nr:ABC transporter substrate-binding protein [Deltaproteobacteria bacterium]MBT4644492.1 ABC transporter substrate-binding protein [Deltaproteobacteria bacterium]MBT6500498.1 ABC transporter substrate-binding protein [Deltaproteobacteria bacterium]MBT6615662.1 ABC transporter substrate-binding protein [Deltaproteobacteria bacterium]MBT7711725.1 ABC transporter substrate-binding protein [Deltaproteobacteria bacterium]
MKNRIKTFFSVTLSTLILVTFNLFGTANAEVGVTDTTIKVGAFFPLSGPVAFIGRPVYQGVDTYFKLINDQGGIHGRKIEYIVGDDGFKPEKSLAITKKLVEQDKIFAMAAPAGTANNIAVQPYLLEHGVPVVWPVSNAARFSGAKYRKRTYFAVQNRTDDESSMYIRYAVEGLDKKRIVAILPRGAMAEDALIGIKRGIKRQKQRGKEVELVGEIYFDTKDTDFAPFLMKVKRLKPDVIIAYTFLRSTVLLLKGMKPMGLNVPVILTAANNSSVTVALVGAEALEGHYFGGFMDLSDKTTKAKTYLVAAKSYYPKMASKNDQYRAGYSAGQIFVEGLMRAGKNLTRESFIKGLESMNKWNGSFLKDVTFGPERRQGSKSLYMVQFQSGKFVPIIDKNCSKPPCWITTN